MTRWLLQLASSAQVLSLLCFWGLSLLSPSLWMLKQGVLEPLLASTPLPAHVASTSVQALPLALQHLSQSPELAQQFLPTLLLAGAVSVVYISLATWLSHRLGQRLHNYIKQSVALRPVTQ
jgi:hypothetical protein